MNRNPAVFLAALFTLSAVTGFAASLKPNIIFIFADDQRWDALSVVQAEQGVKARYPWFKTPNLDRLASQGVRFRNAFVVNSLCSPSRASFLTGTYGFTNGIVNNHTPFDTLKVTYAKMLHAAGYTTGMVGKWHMGNQVERPGFDYAASFIGQGTYNGATFIFNGKPETPAGWVDDNSTNYAIQFINDNKTRPFVLHLGFKSPHDPRTPPPRRAKDFTGDTARAVPNLNIIAPFISGTPPATPAVDLNYFRCIAAVDDNVGRILDTLDSLGLTNNTVVIFASDNGYYFGEHHCSDKRSAYEEALRIPFIVRYPPLANAGTTNDSMILNIDLAPTLLDFAGVSVPSLMQGKSLRPLLASMTSPKLRSSFFYDYFFETGYTIPTMTAVRTEKSKLIKYLGHPEWTEMFDLATDPYEITNLYNATSAASLKNQLLDEYTADSAAIGYFIPSYADKIPNTGVRFSKDKHRTKLKAMARFTDEKMFLGFDSDDGSSKQSSIFSIDGREAITTYNR